MTNGASTINYSLYSDSGRTAVWGNTIGTNTVAATGNGASQSYTVYGRPRKRRRRQRPIPTRSPSPLRIVGFGEGRSLRPAARLVSAKP
jgi:hypothetical protein